MRPKAQDPPNTYPSVWHYCAILTPELDEQCVCGQRWLASYMFFNLFYPHAGLPKGVQAAVDNGSIGINQQHILVLPIREPVALVLAERGHATRHNPRIVKRI